MIELYLNIKAFIGIAAAVVMVGALGLFVIACIVQIIREKLKSSI